MCDIDILISFIFFFLSTKTKARILIIFINCILFSVLTLSIFLGFFLLILVRTLLFSNHHWFTLNYILTRSWTNHIRMCFDLLRYCSKWWFHGFSMFSINLRSGSLFHVLFYLLALISSSSNSFISFITIILLGKDIHHLIIITFSCWLIFTSSLMNFWDIFRI